MSPYFLLSVLCSTAHASDVEPNDSQAQAVDAGANLLFRGTIDSSTDPDDYFTFEGSDGTYEVWLTEYGSTSVSLTLETSSGTVATASSGSSAHGLYLSAAVSAGTTYYVHVSASSGSGLYRLRGRMVWDPPVISSISASSGSAGDSITLSGTDLGSSVDAVSAVSRPT